MTNKSKENSLEYYLEQAALSYFGQLFVESMRNNVRRYPASKEPTIKALELLIQELKDQP